MQLKRPLSDLRDLGVVDLNLVVRSGGYGRRREQDRRKCKTPWRDHAGIFRPTTRALIFCPRKLRPWLHQSHNDLENEPRLAIGPTDQAAHVRFGSKADVAPCLDFVRFTPKSGHVLQAGLNAR